MYRCDKSSAPCCRQEVGSTSGAAVWKQLETVSQQPDRTPQPADGKHQQINRLVVLEPAGLSGPAPSLMSVIINPNNRWDNCSIKGVRLAATSCLGLSDMRAASCFLWESGRTGRGGASCRD